MSIMFFTTGLIRGPSTCIIFIQIRSSSVVATMDWDHNHAIYGFSNKVSQRTTGMVK